MSTLDRDSSLNFQHQASPQLTTNSNNPAPLLLQLPRVSRDCGAAPFKAPTLDDTCLSLKRRHHPQHNQSISRSGSHPNLDNRAARDGATLRGSFNIVRSVSLPLASKRRFSIPGDFVSGLNTGLNRRISRFVCGRRWTLPSKSAPTRSLSTFSPVSMMNDPCRRNASNASPAVITLRRATNPRDGATSITFFPPPRFNQSRSSLVSYFLDVVSGKDRPHADQDRLGMTNPAAVSNYPATRQDNEKQPAQTLGRTAAPTVTEVMIESTIAAPTFGFDSTSRRRCSTKYMAGTSVYEVIWDQDDTPSDSSGTPSGAGRQSDANTRRTSIAAVRLGTQLAKANEAQSRRESVCGMIGNNDASQPSSGERWSFQSMLNSSLSRWINELALRDLPRSKAFSNRSTTVSGLSTQEPHHHTIQDDENFLNTCDVEVFPPLLADRARAQSNTGPDIRSIHSSVDSIEPHSAHSSGNSGTNAQSDKTLVGLVTASRG